MRRHLRCPVTLTALTATLLLAAGRDAVAQTACASAGCHASLLVGKSVHDVADSCEDCHKATATPHPQKGQKTFALTEPQPGLCTTCHDTIGKKAHVHAPVADGECTTCHSPHASAQPKLLSEPMKELCGTCHEEQVGHEKPHGPVATGDCTACHAPHDADGKSLLPLEGEAVCFGCHDDIAKALQKKNVHGAIEQGCTSCHDPHGSAQPKLLAKVGREVCVECHDDVGKKVADAAVGHPPAREPDGCASCHSPHASDHESLLLAPAGATCAGCHETTITRAMTVLHAPVAEGKCGACHDPHGSQHPALLAKEVPAGPYVPYTGTQFELCFSCHKRDLVKYPDTSFATGFRDGEKNLHFVHVNDPRKGRACELCHDVHGSGNPKLVADSVPFGKWSMPIRFVKTETGGGCSPGCHKPLYYDRESPGRRPDAPERRRERAAGR